MSFWRLEGRLARSSDHPNDALPPGRFPAILRIPSLNDLRPNNIGSPRLYTS